MLLGLMMHTFCMCVHNIKLHKTVLASERQAARGKFLLEG